jgi:hypothetical protein
MDGELIYEIMLRVSGKPNNVSTVKQNRKQTLKVKCESTGCEKLTGRVVAHEWAPEICCIGTGGSEN